MKQRKPRTAVWAEAIPIGAAADRSRKNNEDWYIFPVDRKGNLAPIHVDKVEWEQGFYKYTEIGGDHSVPAPQSTAVHIFKNVKA